jgi:NAD(P)H-dependent flavin oxidoreductase YrpB (nitropropane dioxygenase family)
VLIGTRFVATKEAGAREEWTTSIIRAKASDTVLTVCFHGVDLQNAPHRVLRNRTLEMWEAAGCPQPGKRPGEGDIVATNAMTGAVKRYGPASPAPDDRGALTELAIRRPGRRCDS